MPVIVKSFTGTLLVHQVTGSIYRPNKLVVMKSLTCFFNTSCEHYKLHTLKYKNVFTDSEEDIPSQNLRKTETITDAGTSKDQRYRKVTYGSGDYVLVKLLLKNKEYLYAAICSNYDDEGELTVTFLKVCHDEGKLFKFDYDIRYEDVIVKLPIPSSIDKGDRDFYKFKKAVNIFEK